MPMMPNSPKEVSARTFGALQVCRANKPNRINILPTSYFVSIFYLIKQGILEANVSEIIDLGAKSGEKFLVWISTAQTGAKITGSSPAGRQCDKN
jgi:hypothetical protein